MQEYCVSLFRYSNEDVEEVLHGHYLAASAEEAAALALGDAATHNLDIAEGCVAEVNILMKPDVMTEYTRIRHELHPHALQGVRGPLVDLVQPLGEPSVPPMSPHLH